MNPGRLVLQETRETLVKRAKRVLLVTPARPEILVILDLRVKRAKRVPQVKRVQRAKRVILAKRVELGQRVRLDRLVIQVRLDLLGLQVELDLLAQPVKLVKLAKRGLRVLLAKRDPPEKQVLQVQQVLRATQDLLD